MRGLGIEPAAGAVTGIARPRRAAGARTSGRAGAEGRGRTISEGTVPRASADALRTLRIPSLRAASALGDEELRARAGRAPATNPLQTRSEPQRLPAQRSNTYPSANNPPPIKSPRNSSRIEERPSSWKPRWMLIETPIRITIKPATSRAFPSIQTGWRDMRGAGEPPNGASGPNSIPDAAWARQRCGRVRDSRPAARAPPGAEDAQARRAQALDADRRGVRVGPVRAVVRR